MTIANEWGGGGTKSSVSVSDEKEKANQDRVVIEFISNHRKKVYLH